MSRTASPARFDAAALGLVGALLAAHYAVPPHVLWIHALLSWAFLIPVLVAAANRGLRGGLGVAALTSVGLAPHAFGLSRIHGLSANTIWMDLVTLLVAGGTSGWLRDRWRLEEERGERIRSLRFLARIHGALERDLGCAVPSIRGLLVSLDPFKSRVPGIAPALRAMDHSIAAIESLMSDLLLLRLDSRFGFVRLDRVLETARERLNRVAADAPPISVIWRSSPALIPGSQFSLGTAIAALVLHAAPDGSPVDIVVLGEQEGALIEIHPRAGSRDSMAPPSSTRELACQVIEAHGGWVADLLADPSPRVSVFVPAMLRIRPDRRSAHRDPRSLLRPRETAPARRTAAGERHSPEPEPAA